MNPRILVVVVVAFFVALLGVMTFSGQSIINDTSEGGFFSPPTDASRQVLPITIELEDLTVLEVTDKFATLQIKFKVLNPNYNSVILQYIRYQIFENNLVVHSGLIGEQPQGFVMGSNYFIILNERPSILSDRITIKNTGNTEEFWSALTSNTLKWKINGEAFFNLSSMISGAEKRITFEFTV
ncbi:MAG: hypothetical protein IH841_03150 [Thaumarchaeota archaeon]|nr:hypothetical protein [Nitrososphaerota archaeon]